MTTRLPPGLVLGLDGRPRCAWGASAPEYLAYHDDEWGRPVVDDRRLFEKLCHRPTTLQAFMQAMGLVNDHVEGCAVRDACAAARAQVQRQ